MNRSVQRWLSSVKDSLRRRLRPHSVRDRNRTLLAVEPLESRELLAVTANLASGILTFTATAGTEDVDVTETGGNQIGLSATGNITADGTITDLNLPNGNPTATYSLASVTSIVFVEAGGTFGTIRFLGTAFGARDLTATAANITIDTSDLTARNVSLTATTLITLADDLIASGTNVLLKAATISQTNSADAVTVTGGTLNITADAFDLQNNSDEFTALDINITTLTAGRDIHLGNDDTGRLGLDDDDLEGLNATNRLTITASTGGDLVVFAASDLVQASGNVELIADKFEGNEALTATNLRITADEVAIDTTNGSIAATGDLTFQTRTAARSIDLGTETTGAMSLTQAELEVITATTVLAFETTGGAIDVTASIDLATLPVAPTLSLLAAGRIDQAAGTTLKVTSLQATSTGSSVTLTDSNEITNIAGAADADFAVRSTGSLVVDDLPDVDPFATTTVKGITAGTTILLQSDTGTITQDGTAGNGKISAANLGLRAATGIDLPDFNNAVTGNLAAVLTTSGNVRFANTSTLLTIGSTTQVGSNTQLVDIAAITGITSASAATNVTISNRGNLTVAQPIQKDATTRLGIVRLQAVAAAPGTTFDVTQTSTGSIRAGSLGVRAEENIDLLAGATNDVGTFAANTLADGIIEFQDSSSGGLTIGTVAADGSLFTATTGIKSANAGTEVQVANTGGIAVNGAIASTQAGAAQLDLVRLETTAAASNVTQTATISALKLGVEAAGAITLTQDNVVDIFAAKTGTGDIAFTNNDTAAADILTIGTVPAATGNAATFPVLNGVTSGAAVNVTILTDQGLTISQDIELPTDQPLAAIVLTAGNVLTGKLQIDAEVRGLTINGNADNGIEVTSLVKATSTVDDSIAKVELIATGGALTVANGATVDSTNSADAADAQTTLRAPLVVTISGTVSSTGTTTIESTTKNVDLTGTGSITGNTAVVVVGETNVSLNANVTSSAGKVEITADTGNITQPAGTVNSATGTTLQAKLLIDLDSTVDSDALTTITSTNGNIESSGTIGGDTGVTISASTSFEQTAGTIDSASGATGITAGSIDQSGGGIDSATGTTLSAGGTVQLAGTVDSDAATSITSTNSTITQTAGTIDSGTNTTLTAKGAVSLGSTVSATTLLTLTSQDANLVQTGGKLIAPQLLLDGETGINLNQAINDVDVLAGTNVSGNIVFRDADDLQIGQIGAVAGLTAAGQSITLQAQTITQTATGPITANILNLTLDSTKNQVNIDLDEVANAVTTLNATLPIGTGSFKDTDALNLGNISLGSAAVPGVSLAIAAGADTTLTGKLTVFADTTDALGQLTVAGNLVFANAGSLAITFTNLAALSTLPAANPGYTFVTAASSSGALGTVTVNTEVMPFLGGTVTVSSLSVLFTAITGAGYRLVVPEPPFDPNVVSPPPAIVPAVPAVAPAVPLVVQQVAPPVEQEDFGSGGSSLAESVFLVQMYGEGDGNEKFWVISSIEFKDGKETIVGARLNGVELIDELQKAFGVKIAGQFGKYVIEISEITSAAEDKAKGTGDPSKEKKLLPSIRVKFSFNAETQDELLKRLKDIGSDKKKLFEFLQTLPEAQVLPDNTSKPSGSPDGEGAALHPAAAGFLAGVWGSFREGASTVYAAATGERARNVTEVSPQRAVGPRLEATGGRERLFEQESTLEATSSTLLGAAALGAVTALSRRRTGRAEGAGFERDLDGFMETFDAAESRR